MSFETEYALETRACDHCIHFRPLNPGPPICKKHLMGVPWGMKVTYRISDGTCFVARYRNYRQYKQLQDSGSTDGHRC